MEINHAPVSGVNVAAQPCRFIYIYKFIFWIDVVPLRLPTNINGSLLSYDIFLFMYMCLVNTTGMGDGMDN